MVESASAFCVGTGVTIGPIDVASVGVGVADSDDIRRMGNRG